MVKLLIGGSPCTNWSIAQNKNRETEPSGIGWELFRNYLIAKEKFKPDFFLYENNKSASQAIKEQIAKELGVGVDPMTRFTYINSALVSAQNRQRFYVTNFGDIEQPEDRGILLKDILETGEARFNKSYCIDANYYKGENYSNIDNQSGQRFAVAEPVALNDIDGKSRTVRATCYKDGIRNLVANNVDKRTCVAEPVGFSMTSTFGNRNASVSEKAYCLAANPSSDMSARVIEPIRVGNFPTNDGKIKGSQGQRIYDVNGKSVCLSTNSGGKGAKTGLYAIPIEFEDGVPVKATSCADGKTYVVYEVKNGEITIKDKQYAIKLADGYYIIRKLTVTEACRLQTMPDDYCKAVSASRGYQGLGNGWTAEVIIHLLQHANIPLDEEIIVLSMYDGIGTGRYCLDTMGYKNVTYYAYEIDKYPMTVANDNYPDIIQCGDAFQVRNDDWNIMSSL